MIGQAKSPEVGQAIVYPEPLIPIETVIDRYPFDDCVRHDICALSRFMDKDRARVHGIWLLGSHAPRPWNPRSVGKFFRETERSYLHALMVREQKRAEQQECVLRMLKWILAESQKLSTTKESNHV